MSRDEEVEFNKDRARARRRRSERSEDVPRDHSKKNKKLHHRMKPQPTIEELELDDKNISIEIEEYYKKKRY